MPLYSPNSGGGTPGGASGQLQYNNSGAFGGIASLTAFGSPAYVAGRYYLPSGLSTPFQSGSNGANSIRCTTAYFRGQAHLDVLGVSVAVTAASGNVQAAIYAINAATGLPTGTALATTGNLSTAAQNAVTGTVNGGTPVLLGSAINAYTLYAFCTNMDATAGPTAQINATQNNAANISADLGASTATLAAAGNQAGLGSWSVSQAFGTWPDLTAASFTANNFGGPVLIMHFSSVP